MRGGALFMAVASLVLPLSSCSGNKGQAAKPPTMATKEGQESNPSNRWNIIPAMSDNSQNDDAKKLHDFDRALFVGAPDILNAYYEYDDPQNYYTEWPTDGLVSYGQEEYTQAVKSYQECIDYLEALNQDNLSESEKRLVEDMIFDFETKRDYYSYAEFIPALTPTSGNQVLYPLLLSLIQFKSKADIDRYLKVLDDFYDFFLKAIEIEEDRSKAGIGWSDENLDLMIKDCENMIANKNVHFMKTTFESRVGALKLSSTEERSYNEKNMSLLEEKYFPIYELMIKRLTALKGSKKSSDYLASTTRGREYYQTLFKLRTGTSISVDDGIDKLQAKIDEVFDQYYPIWQKRGSIFPFGGLDFDEAREWCERFTKEHFPAISANTVSVYEVPKEFKDTMPPAAYYVSPIDNYTKHTVWLNSGLVGDARYSMYTLISHEMYPGHLYQHQYQAENLDNCYQSFGASTPYAEGWAQYAEWMMIHYAPFEQEMAEAAWMAEMLFSALIAARLSIGVDYQGWDYDRCLTYVKKYKQDEKVMDEYWERITSSQGYALEYAFGYMMTSEIIDDAAKRLDGKCTLEEVVEAYLNLGCAPYEVLSRDMDKFVKENS